MGALEPTCPLMETIMLINSRRRTSTMETWKTTIYMENTLTKSFLLRLTSFMDRSMDFVGKKDRRESLLLLSLVC